MIGRKVRELQYGPTRKWSKHKVSQGTRYSLGFLTFFLVRLLLFQQKQFSLTKKKQFFLPKQKQNFDKKN